MTSVFIPADNITRAPYRFLANNDSKSRQRRLHNSIVFFYLFAKLIEQKQ